MDPIHYRHPIAGEDTVRIARLYRHVREASLPFLPQLHTPDEDLAFFRDQILPANTIWVAESEGEAVGFVAFAPGWVNQLYIEPAHHGRGIGSALLGRAQAGEMRLDLWAFQRNAHARRFYERHGFRLIELTDGSDNEEREPDALYRWERPAAA